jgi:membrane-associated phospholipid phosphatase
MPKKPQQQAARAAEPESPASRRTAPVSAARRRFLKRSGIVTAALASGAALPPLAGLPGAVAEAAEVGPLSAERRRERAYQVRLECAQYQYSQPLPQHPGNDDEALYPNRIACFSKTLPHNRLGEPDVTAYESLIRALRTGRAEDFEAVGAGGGVKLVDPQAAFAFELEGADSHSLAIPAPPAFASEEQGGEMVELYWRALTRDVPFSQYGNEALTAAAVNDLRRFPKYSGVTAASLFKGGLPGEQVGPFVSQFLLKPFVFGSTPIPQLNRTPLAGNDQMTSYETWLDIQNGRPPAAATAFDATPRYIRNGRDLGEYVHRDFSYQAFLNAALILLGFGNAALDDANPYKSSARQAGFATFGGPHVLTLVAQVANAALKAAWCQKWAMHRRIRPEEFAGRVHNHLTRAASYPLDAKLLDSQAAAAVFSRNGTYLLPMAYPEGCPVHPAYPGGHATIAGACVTALKAFFNESFIVPSPVVASDDGLSLLPVGEALTVGGELNKLASHLAYGRDTAGMHWRTDEAAGLLLGEAVAIAILTDQNLTFNQPFAGFTLTKFDGTVVTITTRSERPARTTRR